MLQHTVRFLPIHVTVTVPHGASIYEAAQLCGALPEACCGGNGTCGKCMVEVLAGQTAKRVKACRTPVEEDVTVTVPHVDKLHTLTEGLGREAAFLPCLRVLPVTMEKAALGDPRSEWELLCASARISPDSPPPLSLLSQLGRLRAEGCASFSLLLLDGAPVSLTKEVPRPCMAAFDIGTTTIVCYLLDGLSGEQLAVSSMQNPQSRYGADVITRAQAAVEHGGDALFYGVSGGMNELLENACGDAGVFPGDVALVCVACNTCMHHLLLGLSPASLVRAPYTPVVRQSLTLTPGAVGLSIHPLGRVRILPNIAGFVGADTVGCLLATDFASLPGTSLLIDIGTNGEMVLSSGKRRVACSAAAGPAFEGASISCGMRGMPGAVDHVAFQDGRFAYTVIGGGKPRGLCGSGLIDLIAALLQAGVLKPSGRFAQEPPYPERMRAPEGKPAFLLIPGEETATGEPVLLTLQDVRETQLAKAAVAAGILLLCGHLGIQVRDIQRVLLAGAFGNYLDQGAACRIGLLPSALEGRVQSVGNAAGEGAKLALRNTALFAQADRLAMETEYLELAALPDFQDCFLDQLSFPEGDAP